MEKNPSEQNEKPETPENNPGLRASLLNFVRIAGLALAAAACICLIIAFVIADQPTPAPSTDIAVNSTKESAPDTAKNSAPLAYEEPQENSLEELVKMVDLSLINTLKASGVSMGDLKLEEVTLKEHRGQDFHFQQLRFPIEGDHKPFIESIRKGLLDAQLNASIHEVGKDCWMISTNGVPTHKFFIFSPVTAPMPLPAKPADNAPKMAIVIDDMGEDLALAKGLAALEVPVTFSVWPNSSNAGKTIGIAKNSGNEIMIHLPMQPKGYPKVNPGNDALLVGMTADTIRKRVQDAVVKVPGATGLNNHMGSSFTENKAGMKAVMVQLRKNKLFFLDSRTTPDTVGCQMALQAGVTTYERNIFLDNVKDISAIKYQLSKAAKVARKTGQAIAIGHPNRQTMQAIKLWAAENKGKINVVRVSELKPKG